MNQIAEEAWLLALGNANGVLLRQGQELALIDAGFPNKEQIVFDAIGKLGHQPSDLRHLVFTHGHSDHIGSAAAIVKATGARTYMHPAAAPFAESGGPFRPMTPAPGLLHAIMYKLVWKPNELMQPFRVDQPIADGETLPLVGGLRAIHVPGHCAGQVALIWQGGWLLLGGDTFINIVGVSDPIAFEDEAEGRRSQRKLAALDFETVAFGHGSAILKDAPGKVQRFEVRLHREAPIRLAGGMAMRSLGRLAVGLSRLAQPAPQCTGFDGRGHLAEGSVELLGQCPYLRCS